VGVGIRCRTPTTANMVISVILSEVEGSRRVAPSNLFGGDLPIEIQPQMNLGLPPYRYELKDILVSESQTLQIVSTYVPAGTSLADPE